MSLPKSFFEFSPSLDFGIAVGLGLVHGFSSAVFTGARTDVPISLQDLMPSGVGSSGTYIFPSDSGQEMQVYSTSLSDTSDLLIRGLDENWLEQEETITLQGTTVVSSTKLWSRINQIANRGDTPFLGTVSISNVGNTVVYAQSGSKQRSFNGIYSTPANKYSFLVNLIDSMVKSTGGDTNVQMDVAVRYPGISFITEFQKGVQRSGTSSEALSNPLPLMLPPKTDYKLSAIADAAGANFLVRVSLLLVDDFIVERNQDDL